MVSGVRVDQRIIELILLGQPVQGKKKKSYYKSIENRKMSYDAPVIWDFKETHCT